jgi:hypothetical protein
VLDDLGKPLLPAVFFADLKERATLSSFFRILIDISHIYFSYNIFKLRKYTIPCHSCILCNTNMKPKSLFERDRLPRPHAGQQIPSFFLLPQAGNFPRNSFFAISAATRNKILTKVLRRFPESKSVLLAFFWQESEKTQFKNNIIDSHSNHDLPQYMTITCLKH